MFIRDVLFGLDDRVKVWMALSVGMVAIYCVDLRIQVGLLCLSLALCWACGAKKVVGGFVIAGLVLAVFYGAWVLTWARDTTFSARSLFFIFIKFGPMFAMMAFVQASLNASRFVRCLERMRVPVGWVVPLGVCLRFLPSAVEECRQIRYAMRIRGIGLSPRQVLSRPLETLGYLSAPLLVRSLAIGDELARAAVARGIEAPGTKTSLYDLSLRRSDMAAMLVWTLFMLVLLVADHSAFVSLSGVKS